MSIAEIELRKRAIKADIAAEKARHEAAIHALRAEYAQAAERAQMIGTGIDEEKVLHAEHIIYVYGSYANGGEDRASVIEDAITDILSGGAKLKREHFGTKSYDRWYGQRSDHTYGCGPRHGSIIFDVGLSKSVRSRSDDAPLTPEEIEIAIYYLRNIERIQAAKNAAKSAGASA